MSIRHETLKRLVNNYKNLAGRHIEQAVLTPRQEYLILILDNNQFAIVHGWKNIYSDSDDVAIGLKRDLPPADFLAQANVLTDDEAIHLAEEDYERTEQRRERNDISTMQALAMKYPDEFRKMVEEYNRELRQSTDV